MKALPHRFHRFIGLVFLLMAILPLEAATWTWDGGGADDNWNTQANWVGDVFTPVGGDDLIFTGTTRQNNNNNIGSVVYFRDITLQNGGFTINSPSQPGLQRNLASTGDNAITTSLFLGGGGPKSVNQAAGGVLTLSGVVFQGGTFQDNSLGTTVFGAFSNGGIFRGFASGESVLNGNSSAYTGSIHIFRNAKLTNSAGLGGASTTVRLDRSYQNARIDLNGLDVSGVNISFTSSEVPGSASVARLRNTNTTTAASFAGNIALDFSGAVDGGGDTTYSGVISGAGSLSKFGTGVVMLTGENTYTGDTVAGAGTLLINNTAGSGTGAGTVTVNSGGTLGGSGGFTGAVTVNSGGTLSPGAGIESLATGAVTFAAGSTFAYEMDSAAAPGAGADLLVASTNLALAETVTLTLSDLSVGTFANGATFSLINYSGTWNGGRFTYGGNSLDDGEVFLFNGQNWQIDYNALTGGSNFVGDQISGSFVNLVAIPEPSTLFSLLVAGPGLCLIRFFLRRIS